MGGERSLYSQPEISRKRSTSSHREDSTVHGLKKSFSEGNIQIGGRRQGRYWILTIPKEEFDLFEWEIRIDDEATNVVWMKGQQEIGESGYEHWQIVVGYNKKVSLHQIREDFGHFHAELTRSKAAENYVWKDETAVPFTKFEIGDKPMNRNDKKDWEQIWNLAKEGKIEQVPPDLRIRSYTTLRKIQEDFQKPRFIFREAVCYWGPTGVGKSHRSWNEALATGKDVYVKCPRSKFWTGYQGEPIVIIEEFRGRIDITYLLIWLDRYPHRVEIKCSGRPSEVEYIIINSNLHPRKWYPDLDDATYQALKRRLKIVHMHGEFEKHDPTTCPDCLL